MKDLQTQFTFPFEPHDFQVEAMNEIVSQDCSLLRFKVGLGKTMASTMAALKYSMVDNVEKILILCPPILLDQWYGFLSSIKGIPDICLYRGTPKEREKMKLEESVILVSYNIFRGNKDHVKFVRLAKKYHLCIIADELAMKSLRGKTYQKLKKMVYGKLRVTLADKASHKVIALNATPLSDLGQVYNWCSMFVPGVYISKRVFESIHVVKQDHWGKVLIWGDQESMRDNMNLFSVDTDKEVKLPPLVESVVPYQLSKPHMKLYGEVMESELENLPEEMIDLALRSMFSTLQKLILMPELFGLDIKPPILDYLESYLSQVDDEGVLIYTRHVAVSKMLAERIPHCAAIYGGVSKVAREKAFEDLKSGKIRRLVGNMDSLGVGLDLQMLNHVIFTEVPFRDDKAIQSVGRIHRQGQKETCFAVYPMVEQTIQEQIYYKLLKNKEELSPVLKTKAHVRDFLVAKATKLAYNVFHD